MIPLAVALDDSFDIKDGHVICRVLGYPGAKSVKNETVGGQSGYEKYETFSGHGIGKFALNDLKCKGTEAFLEQCEYSDTPPRINSCRDEEYS